MEDLIAHLRALPAVVMLYTDLDGTLLGPGGSLLTGPDRTPSVRAAAALVDAAIRGVTVVPVSGRGREQLQHDARIMGMRNCIAEAGTVIVRDGTVHYEWGDAPRDIAPTPHDALEASGAIAAILDAFPDDLRLYEPWHEGREGSALLHGEVDVARAQHVLVDGGWGWAQLIDNGATGGWRGRSVRAYHLLPRGTGKAQAVADDLADRGIAAEQALAVGDSEEDRRMADAVGTYVRVANGHGADGRNVFAVPGAYGHGFADAVDAVLAASAAAEP